MQGWLPALAFALAGCGGAVVAEARDVPAEAGADAGSEAAGGLPGPRACARFPEASFCEDFDGLDPLRSSNWTEIVTQATWGHIELVPLTGSSRGARVVLASAGPCSPYSMSRTLSTGGRRVRAHVAARAREGVTFFELRADVGREVVYTLDLAFQASALVVVLRKNIAQWKELSLSKDVIPIPPTPEATTEIDVEVDVEKHAFRVSAGHGSATGSLPNDYVLSAPTFLFGHVCSSAPSDIVFDDIALWGD